MRTRTRAREAALRYLYERDANEGTGCPTPEEYFARHRVPAEIAAFALRLLRGVLSERDGIDRAISAVAANWNLGRMAVIDRNLLRIGVWELQRTPDVPPEVVINEAIDLAKRYGSAQSGAFVNGILDRILKGPKAADAPAPLDPQRSRAPDPAPGPGSPGIGRDACSNS